jgi:uncharacterized SAM-binding protein YcdF (DUF218 family)
VREQARALGTGALAGGAAAFAAKDLGLASLVSYWGDTAPLVILAAVAAALLWRTRLRLLVGAAAAGLALLWVVVAATPLTALLAAGLVRRDEPIPSDAIFVSSSRMQDDGDPDSTSLARLVHGIELLGERQAPRLVVSELAGKPPLVLPFARSLVERFAIGAEVMNVKDIRNSHDEAVAVAALMRERGWTRLLLVTSPAHSRRAAASLEAEGIEVVSSPSRETRYDLERLDRWDDRLVAFGALIHEHAGLRLYGLRGWLEPPR